MPRAPKRKTAGLVISVSGIRGIVGEGLTPEVALRFAQAFGTYTKAGKIILARDPRKSGVLLKSAAVAGLLSTGCEVIDLGLATTPTLALMTKELKARGGLVITGSHNTGEWNALKFFSPEGIYLNHQELDELLKIYARGKFLCASWDEMKSVSPYRGAARRHLRKVLKVVDKEAIRKRHFRVAIDSCNGAGGRATLMLLKELGCKTTALYCEPTGLFPHDPEPIPGNLKDISQIVKEKRCDVGFAQDADADRVAIISDEGRPLGEEYTLALAAAHILKKHPGPVVMNLSTSRMTEDVARRLGLRSFRTPVGELNVVERMKEVGAVIGGEGNGGVIYPPVQYARDSLVAIALILEFMAETGKTISELAHTLPRYFMLKTKMQMSAVGRRPSAPKRMTHDARLKSHENLCGSCVLGRATFLDGLRIDWQDEWAHIRKSGTEPVIRIITEARTKKRARQLNAEMQKKASQIIGMHA